MRGRNTATVSTNKNKTEYLLLTVKSFNFNCKDDNNNKERRTTGHTKGCGGVQNCIALA